MPAAVALAGRVRFATLLPWLLHEARRRPGWRGPNRCNLRTRSQVVRALVVGRSTRLVPLGRTLLGARRAKNAKNVGIGPGRSLRRA